MRSIVLLLAASLLLAACLSPSGDTSAPQTPLPSPTLGVRDTPTLIPTSTPHPDFLSLQEKIAAGGETFTLTQDGQIEMWTEEEGARIVPGIQVHPDGTMTFTHDGQEYEVDTETLEIQDQTITFEDTEGRIWAFDGVNWEDKTTEVQLAEDMKIFNLSMDDYKITYDAEGKIELRDKSNRLVYWDGKWNKDLVVDMVIATNDCQATEFIPASPTANWSTNISLEEFKDYIFSISQAVDITSIRRVGYPAYRPVPLRRTQNCWGIWISTTTTPPAIFAWSKASGEVVWVDIFDPKIK